MRKRIVLLAVMVCTLIFLTGPASAVSLWLEPSLQNIAVGGIASVDLVVGGLGDFMPDSLGSFFVDITYDPSILSIADTDVTFGSLLGDPVFFEADTFASVAGGVVHLDETTFLFDFELDAIQPASFTLATLDFTGIAVGFSRLDFLTADLSNPYGFTIDLGSFGSQNVRGADISASASAVPEPATMLLLGAGLAGLAGVRRKVTKS